MDDASQPAGATDAATEDTDEYVFDGFRIMFNEKVMLTAVTPTAPVASSPAERLH